MDTLIDLLRQSADQFESRTALAINPGFRQERWTYRQLWEASGRTAVLLRERGLEKGDRVLIWAPNRPEWVVGFFGCLRAGMTVVPLDVRSAPDYVDRIIRRSDPKLAFSSQSTPGDPSHHGVPTISLEELEAVLAEQEPVLDEPTIEGREVAEVMFTSGTTGDPKGVMLTHGNKVNEAQRAGEAQGVEDAQA